MTTDVTVQQFAESINVPVEKLVSQLESAGVFSKQPEDKISQEEKQLLLTFLKAGSEAKGLSGPKKITLRRTSVSELKVTQSSGKKTTVSVVRKQRRVYVKRDNVGETEAESLMGASVVPASYDAQHTDLGLPLDAGDLVIADQTVLSAESALEDVPSPNSALQAASTRQDEELSAAAEKGSPQAQKPGPKKPDKNQKLDKPTFPKKSLPAGGGAKHANQSAGQKAGGNFDADWKKSKGKILKQITIVAQANEEPEVALLDDDRPRRKKPKRMLTEGFKKSGVTLSKVQESLKKHVFEKPTAPVVYEIEISETIVLSELAQKMSIKSSEVIKTMMKMGSMVTINQVLDQTTAALIVEEFGHKAKFINANALEESLSIHYTGEALESVKVRAPVVTVMGHVDHGKTSLLDCIRRTKVAEGEAGGITQHVGAYSVKTLRGNVTFLDTPGHAAFTAMRARGAQATDLVVLVVAADDGVMPQTIEAIQHAKAAGVPIIVAVNKIDKSGADLDKIQSDLAHYELIPEAWGGETMFIPVSAKVGTGIDTLLEAILLQAELLDLKAVDKGPAQGVVLETKLDRGRGVVANLLVQQGALLNGDIVLAGVEYGRVKAMTDDQGRYVKQAGPSTPIEILGLSGLPNAGDEFIVVPDEKRAREVALLRQDKEREARLARQSSSKLEGLFAKLQQSDSKALNIILKSDVQGSAEALSTALENLSSEQVKVKIMASGVGGINESDVNLAMASQAILIGFNVRADTTAKNLAEKEGIKLHYYSIIYDVLDHIKSAISGLLGPIYEERQVGLAVVRDVFRSPKIGAIAGCMVTEGAVKRGYLIRVLRDHVVVYQGELESLRRFKEDVSEVRQGTECGIGVKNYNDIKLGDQIEVYETVEVKREIK